MALGKILKLKIFGSDWDTIDWTDLRDYIHVMDLAEGHLSALNYLANEEPQFIAINIGDGYKRSFYGAFVII